MFNLFIIDTNPDHGEVLSAAVVEEEGIFSCIMYGNEVSLIRPAGSLSSIPASSGCVQLITGCPIRDPACTTVLSIVW